MNKKSQLKTDFLFMNNNQSIMTIGFIDLSFCEKENDEINNNTINNILFI